MGTGKIIIIFLAFYCFVGQFIESTIGVPYVRLISCIGILIFVPLYFVEKKDIKVAKISMIIILFALIYFIVGAKPPTSALYTILFGYYFYKESCFGKKVLDVIFVIQVICMLYETITGTFLYSDITTGIITTKDVEGSAEIALNEDDETGFRPKGLYMGTLEAAAFNIYYCLINKESKTRLYCTFLTAFLINGRLSILISSIVLFVFLFKKYRHKIVFTKILITSFVILFFLIILYVFSPLVQERFGRVVSTFDISENSNNSGRLLYYYFAYKEYFYEYDLKCKLFGSEFELFNEWGKKVTAESDLLSMLLEMGLVGTLIYIFALVNMLRYNSNTVISARLVTILTLIGYLEYRHATGNIRGTLFWCLYFTTVNPPNFLNKMKLKIKKAQK